jgi:integrase
VSWHETYERKSDAVRVLAELERQSQAAGGRLDAGKSKIKLEDYADRWLKQHPRLRPHTADVYSSLLRRHVLPQLGPIPLARLDTATMREWRAARLQAGVSPTMVAKSYRLLRAILNTVVTEDELIASNPCRIKGAGEERTTERPVLSLDQLYALVDRLPDRWRAFVLLKTFASLRWGEITALTRDDLDLEHRTVRVRRQFITVPGGLELGPPKSRAGIRLVSFPAGVLPELEHHLATYSSSDVDGLVFVNEHGNPLCRGSFNRAVHCRQVCTDIGVPHLHLHDLRHTGNTFAAQSGASLRDLMTRMGHDSPAAALIYQHSSRVADEAIADALDARLRQRLTQQTTPSASSSGPAEGPGWTRGPLRNDPSSAHRHPD